MRRGQSRAPACDDGRVRSGIIFRAAASRGYAVGSWVIAGALLVAFLSHGGLAEVVRYGALPLALAVAGWALFWRPEVRVRPGGVEVVNVVSTSWLPWAAITGTRTRWGLELSTPQRAVSAWALPARSTIRRWTSTNRTSPPLPDLATVESAVPGGSDPGVAAGIIEEHRTGSVGDPTRAEHRVDALPAGLLLGAVALAAATLLL